MCWVSGLDENESAEPSLGAMVRAKTCLLRLPSSSFPIYSNSRSFAGRESGLPLPDASEELDIDLRDWLLADPKMFLGIKEGCMGVENLLGASEVPAKDKNKFQTGWLGFSGRQSACF